MNDRELAAMRDRFLLQEVRACATCRRAGSGICAEHAIAVKGLSAAQQERSLAEFQEVAERNQRNLTSNNEVG